MKDKIVNWIKAHPRYVIILLLAIILLQCCNGCKKSTNSDFQAAEYQKTIDTLNLDIAHQRDTIIELRMEITNVRSSLEQLKLANEDLKAALNKPIIITEKNRKHHD